MRSKIKKLLGVVLSATLLFSTLSVSAIDVDVPSTLSVDGIEVVENSMAKAEIDTVNKVVKVLEFKEPSKIYTDNTTESYPWTNFFGINTDYNERDFSLEFDDSIEFIGYKAFIGCEYKGFLKLPSNLTEIYPYAFWGCWYLDGNLNLPDSLRIIGKYAFGQTNFDSYNLNEGLETIGDYAFYETHVFPSDTAHNDGGSFNTLYIPNSVKTIGNWAFYRGNFDDDYYYSGVLDLSSTNITSIGEEAFAMQKFSKVILPSCLTSLGASAFEVTGVDAVSLTDIDFNHTSITLSDFEFRAVGGFYAKSANEYALNTKILNDENISYITTDGTNSKKSYWTEQGRETINLTIHIADSAVGEIFYNGEAIPADFTLKGFRSPYVCNQTDFKELYKSSCKSNTRLNRSADYSSGYNIIDISYRYSSTFDFFTKSSLYSPSTIFEGIYLDEDKTIKHTSSTVSNIYDKLLAGEDIDLYIKTSLDDKTPDKKTVKIYDEIQDDDGNIISTELRSTERHQVGLNLKYSANNEANEGYYPYAVQVNSEEPNTATTNSYSFTVAEDTIVKFIYRAHVQKTLTVNSYFYNRGMSSCLTRLTNTETFNYEVGDEITLDRLTDEVLATYNTAYGVFGYNYSTINGTRTTSDSITYTISSDKNIINFYYSAARKVTVIDKYLYTDGSVEREDVRLSYYEVANSASSWAVNTYYALNTEGYTLQGTNNYRKTSATSSSNTNLTFSYKADNKYPSNEVIVSIPAEITLESTDNKTFRGSDSVSAYGTLDSALKVYVTSPTSLAFNKDNKSVNASIAYTSHSADEEFTGICFDSVDLAKGISNHETADKYPFTIEVDMTDMPEGSYSSVLTFDIEIR